MNTSPTSWAWFSTSTYPTTSIQAVCDNLDETFESFQQAQLLYEENFADADVSEDLIEVLNDDLGYVIEPSLTFTKLVQSIHEGTFQLESLAQSFRDIEQANEKIWKISSKILTSMLKS